MGYRQRLIKIFTFLGGVYFFLEFILPSPLLSVRIDKYHEEISLGFTAISSLAIGLGLINIVIVHGAKIAFQRPGWVNSTALLLGLVIMIVITVANWLATERIGAATGRVLVLRDFILAIERDQNENRLDVPPFEIRRKKFFEELSQTAPSCMPEFDSNRPLSSFQPCLEAAALSLRSRLNADYEQSQIKKFYNVLYDGLFTALGAAMFSLLGFYMAVAAYRAFRLRSLESGLMLAAALLVMLGQIPFGMYVWGGLADVRLWILSVPNSAAFRAIKIGAGVAGLVMAFRMWFSIESGSFGKKSRG